MNILVIGNFTTGWDGSICDEEHIAKALEDKGHTVARWQRENREDPYQGSKYDFILIAQWNGYPVDMVKELKSSYSDTPIVYWAFDYQYDKNDVPAPEEWHMRLASEADVFLSKELEHQHIYRHLGCNFHWLSQDFAPEFLDATMDDTPQEYDVLFTGSHLPWSPERTELLKAVDEKFNLHIFSVTPDQWKSEGFKNVNGPVMDKGLPELYAKAKINLSIDWKLSEGYWSDRNAQIMCCGGFVLFRYVPLSETVFRDKIGYFYNKEDMLEKIQHYLDDYTDRTTKRWNGQVYASNYLKVGNRVEDMLTIVKAYL